MHKTTIRLLSILIISIVFLTIGYFFAGAFLAVSVNTQMMKAIYTMKNLGNAIVGYKNNNGNYPKAENIQELLEELKFDTDKLETIKKDEFNHYVKQVKYIKPSDDNDAMLLWSSTTLRSFDLGRYWMKRYHNEVRFTPKDGVFSGQGSKIWEE